MLVRLMLAAVLAAGLAAAQGGAAAAVAAAVWVRKAECRRRAAAWARRHGRRRQCLGAQRQTKAEIFMSKLKLNRINRRKPSRS